MSVHLFVSVIRDADDHEQDNPSTPPKTLDLSDELLSHGAVEALSDLLSVDFGLKKLTLESCGIDDEVRPSFPSHS